MGRMYLAALPLAALVAAGAAAAVTAQSQEATPVTFHKEILPILQKNCQTCHRPGSIAPMSLLTYEEARPWARSMKAQGRVPADAALVRRSAGRQVRQRSVAEAGRHRYDREVGRQRRAGGRSEGRAGSHRVAGRRLADQAGRDRERTVVPDSRASARERDRVDLDRGSERLHEGHLGHVDGTEADRHLGDASHLHRVQAAHPGRAVLHVGLERQTAR